MSETELARLRNTIADIDKEIIALVAKRMHFAAQVGLEKRRLGRSVRDESVEEDVHARFSAECAVQGISPSFAENLASLLIDESVRRQQSVRTPPRIDQRVLVVGGNGRMGRWLCRYFRSRGLDVFVNDPARPPDDFPLESDLGAGVRQADIIAVSVPMSVAASILRVIAQVRPRALVFDICSLKAPIENELRAMSRAGLRVASVHPLFGPGLWPLSSGTVTFSDCGSGDALLDAKELFRPTGAALIDVSLEHHDEFMAYLLGLSHLCLLTFARCAAESPIDFAGLRRPAGTTFSRLCAAADDFLVDSPGLLRDIQTLNPHMPLVYARFRETLSDWQRASIHGGTEFERLLDEARAYLTRGTSR